VDDMDRCLRPGAAVAALVLAACGGSTVPTREGPAPTAGGGTSGLSAASLPPDGVAVDERRIEADLAAIADLAASHGDVRAVGTDGYDASVGFVADELDRIGFDVSTPEVPYTTFAERPGATLTVGDERFSAPEDVHALIYSAGGDVSGPVVVLEASGCEASDFADVDAGSIVVTSGGGCFRRDQALNAIDAGAAAFVVGYPDRGPGEIFRPTLIDAQDMTIPVVSVTDAALGALEVAAAEGGTAELHVETEREPGSFHQVVGALGDGPRVVLLGAHLDSVFEGPGLNDNGSGVVALLEAARGIAAAGVPEGATLRIAFWGAEELGTVGSRAYAASDDAAGVVAYLNVDMAGSVNGANLVYDEAIAAPGSEAITELLETWFADRGIPTGSVDLGGSSDHAGFVAAGIPTGGLFAGATASGSAALPAASGSATTAPDPCYHLACDTLENVDIERVGWFAGAIADVALALAAGR
jgi:Peptidase family M28/PA domain